MTYEEPNKNTVMMCRACFQTDEGRRVFAHLLNVLGYYKTEVKDEEVPLRDFANYLMQCIGVYDGDVNQSRFVDKLFELGIQ